MHVNDSWAPYPAEGVSLNYTVNICTCLYALANMYNNIYHILFLFFRNVFIKIITASNFDHISSPNIFYLPRLDFVNARSYPSLLIPLKDFNDQYIFLPKLVVLLLRLNKPMMTSLKIHYQIVKRE